MPTLDELAPVVVQAEQETPQAEPSAEKSVSLDDIAPRVDIPDSDLSEKAAAISKGGVAGTLKSGAVVAGTAAGAGIGTAVFPGPGTLVGAGAGFVAGIMAGEELQRLGSKVELPFLGETLTFESMEATPQNLRPYAVAGETFGAGLPFVQLPFKAAADGVKFGPDLVGRLYNSIIQSAARGPNRFLFNEGTLLASAAAAGGVAEKVDPGAFATRLVFETFGGILNPAARLTNFSRFSFDKVKSGIGNFTGSGPENRAAIVLQKIFEDAGDDPAAVAALIRERAAEFPQLNLTAGQLTGDPLLLGLEKQLIKESEKFGFESKKMAEDSLSSMKLTIEALNSIGDQNSLILAAQLRDNYFESLLNTRLRMMEDEALEVAGKIDVTNTVDRAEFGRQTFKVLKESMNDVRAEESRLWGLVDQEIELDAVKTIGRFSAIKREERLPTEKLPKVAEDFISLLQRKMIAAEERAAKEGGVPDLSTSTGEIIIFRSRMLQLSREAAAKNDWSDARVFGELAEAALEDLNDIPAITKEYGDARSYSRTLNDTFSRTFAGMSMERKGSGAQRIPPELLMARALSTGREVGELQLRQLEDAARFAGSEHLSRMMDIQERTIRFAAGKTINSETGRVDHKKLGAFVQDNKTLLARFPEIRDQLTNAVSAEKLLRATEVGTRQARKTIQAEAAFAKIIQFENPVKAVSQALTGRKPSSAYQRIAKLAKRAGPKEVDGLMSATMNVMYDKAVTPSGTFSFTAYRNAFEGSGFVTARASKKPLKEMMVENGILSKEHAETISRYLKRAEEIETAIGSKAAIDDISDAPDMLIDLVTRLAGADVLTRVSIFQSAHPLIIGEAGSRLFRQVFDKVPAGKARTIMIEAAKDPQRLAMLLERPTTKSEKIKLALQMNAWLWQMGVTIAPEVKSQEVKEVDIPLDEFTTRIQ